MTTKVGMAIRHWAPTGDSGSGSVLVLGVCLVMVLLGVIATQLGAGLVAKRETALAADLSALAGASHVNHDPCDTAEKVAERNGARVVSCELDGLEVTLEVRRELRGPLAAFGAISVRARAGPVRMA